MIRNLKITFCPWLPGEAWQMRYGKNGEARRAGKPFPGQWIVFDRADVPAFHTPAPQQILFSAPLIDACHAWIEAHR